MDTSIYIKEYPALSKKLCKTLLNTYDKYEDDYAQEGRILTNTDEPIVSSWQKRCKEFTLADIEGHNHLKYETMDNEITEAVIHYFWKYAQEHPYTLQLLAALDL